MRIFSMCLMIFLLIVNVIMMVISYVDERYLASLINGFAAGFVVMGLIAIILRRNNE